MSEPKFKSAQERTPYEFFEQGFYAGYEEGRKSMLEELRAKWPSEMEIMDEVYKATRDTGFCYSDLAVWLKEKIFGGVDELQ
jgi:hypothetical protein